MAIESFQKYFDTSQLALAAYSDFSGMPLTANGGLDATGVKGQLIASGDFQSAAAQQFIDKFQVVDQFTDPSLLLNGFSATVFRHKQTGQTYFITRGTENSGDWLADGDLAIGVSPRAQIVSMVNYFLRLQAGAGNVARQIKTSSILPSYGVEFDNSRTVMGVGVGINLDQLVVAGHSLGGYLATVFGRLYGDKVSAAYTFNAPGAYGGFGLLDNIARLLGRTPSGFLNAGKQTNVVGDYIISAVPGRRGETVRIFEEGDAHSQKAVVDSLALHAVFGELDTSLKAAEVRGILRASANKDADSLESSLDGLRKLFLGSQVGLTKAPGADDTDATRESYYQNLGGLRDSSAFTAWAGQLGVVSLQGRPADEINSLAKRDVSYRYALKELNPFAITGAPGLYDQSNANGELAVDDPATGEGALSNEWLKDRSQFLTWKIQKNTNDIPEDVALRRKDNGAESYLYTDKTLKNSLGQDYSIRVTGGTGAQQINISFASDEGNALTGGNYADRLYGAKGKDTLAGGAGNDYLEGGAEVDTLRGDAGNDTLIGGKGNDVLQGGGGNDLYIIRAGDGQDKITDHEGSNTVVYEDASGRRTVLGVAAFAVAKSDNTWSANLSGGGTVSFTKNSPLTASLPGGTQIILDDYQEGDFGIHLQAPNQDGPVFTREIVGDLVPIIFGEPEYHYEYDDLGNVVAVPGEDGEGGENHLWGSAGNDLIEPGTGPDTVIAKGGDDRIVASGADDYLDGGDGDDLIEGGMDVAVHPDDVRNREFLVGGKGNDRLYANREVELSEDVIAGPPYDETLSGNGAVLIGGAGDDIALGSDFRDALCGGMGKDVLAGGGDNDTLCGDKDLELVVINPDYPGAQRSRIAEYSVVFDIAEGDDDILFGGNGDDWVYGNGGDDWMSGGDGHDSLIGGPGSDSLFGDGGNDSLSAASRLFESAPSDYDVLDGGDGDDAFAGGAGFNLMFGGVGNDNFQNGTGDTLAYGGEGDDEFSGIASGASEFYGEAGNDILRALRGESYLDGGEGDDSLIGGDAADVLIGGAGDDSLEAFQNDVLEGGVGDDIYKFRLGSGTNTIIDTEGANQIALYSIENPDWVLEEISRESLQLAFEDEQYSIRYGDRGDRILLGADEFESLQGLTLRHLTGYDYVQPEDEDADAIQVEVFSDEFIAFSELDLQRLGTDGDDYLDADDYRDGDTALKTTLDGKAGDDFLIGSSAADTLIGGSGKDLLLGGAGGDIYRFGLGSGHDVVFDSDATPNNIDTVVLGDGITPGDVSVLRGVGRLTLAFAGSADRLDLQWQPEEGELIERVRFANGTIWDSNWLESRAVPDPQADPGAGAVDGDTGAGDGGGTSGGSTAGGETTGGGATGGDTAGGGTTGGTAGDGTTGGGTAGSGTTGGTTASDGSGTSAGSGGTGSDAGPASSSGTDTAASTSGGTETATSGGDAPAAGTGSASASDNGTVTSVDAGSPSTAVLDSPSVAEMVPKTDNTASTAADSVPASNNDVLAATAAGKAPTTDALAPKQESKNSSAGEGTDTPSPPERGERAGVRGLPATSTQDANAQSEDSGGQESSDDIAALDANSTPAADDAVPSADIPESSEIIAETPESTEINQAPKTADKGFSTTPQETSEKAGVRGLPVAAIPTAQETFAASLHQLAATEATAPPTQARTSAKPINLFDAPSAPTQLAIAPSTASLIPASQPSQPSLQTWLDNWLGPSGRAGSSASSSNNSSTNVRDALNSLPPTGAGQPSSVEDVAPTSPAVDMPEAQPGESLTPDQITQRYEDIERWLAANPGIEQGIAGASGAMPERNLFASLSAGYARDAGTISMPRFGETPGMNPIAGNALQPLRGIKEGYTLLGVI